LGGDSRFFHGIFSSAAFFIRHISSPPRMGKMKTALPLRSRGLVHASLTVIQNPREPALDLRDAHAIAVGVTSLSTYGGWVRRPRRAELRWEPDNRPSQER
jgi:hypothetical protein